jgi:ligand-binding SRPBCC domain-containing protein
MGLIKIETIIKAPPSLCFDLARSADFHVASTTGTAEKIIGGVTTGLMELGDLIVFEASHFKVRQKLAAKIVAFDRPKHFRDVQVSGIFKSFEHDHFFDLHVEGTKMRDVFRFECPLGFLGQLVDPLVARHLKAFLKIRSLEIKRAAEDGSWRSYVKDPKAPEQTPDSDR